MPCRYDQFGVMRKPENLPVFCNVCGQAQLLGCNYTENALIVMLFVHWSTLGVYYVVPNSRACTAIYL